MNIIEVQRKLNAGKYKIKEVVIHTTYVVKLENGCSINLLYVNDKFDKIIFNGKEKVSEEMKKFFENWLSN